jgi:hypothetical protein
MPSISSIVPEDLIAPDQSARLEQLRRFALSLDQYRHLAKWRIGPACYFYARRFR